MRVFQSALRGRILRAVSLGLLVPWLMSGCGEGDGTAVVKRPAAERPDVDDSLAAKGSLLIPTAAPFNLTSFTSGQTGVARGESAAIGRDAARCSTKAEEGGSSWAEFQLGYCFDNTAGRALDASVKLKLRLNETKSHKAADEEQTSGKSALRFLIKDSMGQTLRSEELAVSTLMKGPQSNSTTHDIVFDARFEPERGYYLVLVGRVEAQAAPGDSAGLAMDIQNVALEIDWRLAPSARAGTAGVE
jgi:hypothetical protein